MQGKYLTLGTESHTILGWSKKLGISRATIQRRLKERPGDVPYALRKTAVKYKYQGKLMSFTELSKALNVHERTLRRYLDDNRPIAWIARWGAHRRDYRVEVEVNGNSKSLSDWARHLGVSRQAVWDGYKRRGVKYLEEKLGSE